tara:strand:+ start:19136 stop:21409 length:2274 start_codon:yes stop_codon:yes gene_type:complete
MRLSQISIKLFILIGIFTLSACATRQQVALDNALLTQYASTDSLPIKTATVITDNDQAFASKLALINQATTHIDLAYYIFSDDHTSSVLAQALINAAKRGVKIRILLDYLSTYKDLDRLSYLQQAGNGNIQVRLYGRPSQNIIKDAVYLTLGCGQLSKADAACNQNKYAQIEQLFDDEKIENRLASDIGISNLSTPMSAIFLSGLYGKNPELMAFSLEHGQSLDIATLSASTEANSADTQAKLKQLGKLYYQANYQGGLASLTAKIQLATAKIVLGDQINPVLNSISSFLPTERENNAAARQDWDYLTEFLHHKLLLVDQRIMQLGGRNVENSYHMNPNALASKYIFMDTDVRLAFNAADPQVTATFERLWNFKTMVASLDEIREHAPNDFLMNLEVYKQSNNFCTSQNTNTQESNDQATSKQACVDQYYQQHFVSLDQRLAKVEQSITEMVDSYNSDYQHPTQGTSQSFSLDTSAQIYYLENLPFFENKRGYGSIDGKEAEYGKAIHATWLASLKKTCEQATANNPLQVIIHNAYFFMPSNLLAALGSMVDGSWDCPYVSLQVITNSIETTDLNVVNLLAMWQMKAFEDYRAQQTSTTSATFNYSEYQHTNENDISTLSLHSKVMLFGDDLFIGSANADVRSYMLDTNNGLMIINAPDFVKQYKQWLAAKIDGRPNIADKTEQIGTSQQALKVKMNHVMDILLAKYDKNNRIDAGQAEKFKEEVQGVTQRIYNLSTKILNGDKKAQDEFNRLFKTI